MQLRLLGTAAALAILVTPAVAKETITMWFWGAPPAYRDVLDKALTQPFNSSQDDYELVLEYYPQGGGVDNAVRVSLMANEGPDIVYTSGPADVTPLAKAGKLEPLEAYAEKYGWNDRLLTPVLDTCRQLDHLYCLPPSFLADGMFFNKRVLADNGWEVPKTAAEVETIMKAAQAKGLYASVTGNKGWPPVNENYVSIFMNQMVGPKDLYGLLSGTGNWASPEMVAAMAELDRWYKAGYLGGSDYLNLNFDMSLALLSQQKSPFFFAPNFAYQWAINHFTGDATEDLGFTAFPQMREDLPYPVYSIGSAFTLSINANSKVKDGAAMVLDRIMSPEFVIEMAKVWPGYWAVPLNDFPDDPEATGIVKAFYTSMKDIVAAVKDGKFGYKVSAFFPPATKELLIQDIESVWLGNETPDEMMAKVVTTFKREFDRGLVQNVTAPNF